MKKARLTEEQIIGILQKHEAGAKCVDLCSKHGMSEGRFYGWKAKHSGMTVSEGRHWCAIGPSDNGDAAEGARGRERKAEEALGRANARHGGDEGTALKKMVTLAVKREAVAHLKAHLRLSERRACEITGADRKMVRYQSQPAPDTALRGRLRDLADVSCLTSDTQHEVWRRCVLRTTGDDSSGSSAAPVGQRALAARGLRPDPPSSGAPSAPPRQQRSRRPPLAR
jgi:hypothetical protein